MFDGMARRRPGGAGDEPSSPAMSCGPSTRIPAELADALGGLDLDRATDEELISQLDLLERAKAACAAAQARLTARFVDTQAAKAKLLRAEAQACSDAGDFDGWVAARDHARALELVPTQPGSSSLAQSGREGPGGRRSRAVRQTLTRTGVAAQVALARHESPARGVRLANLSVALVQDLPHTLAALTVGAINERRAELVVRGTSHLAPEVRTLVDSEVVGAHLDLTDPFAGVGSWGDRELERRVRASADRLDAQGAVERARTAESERRVTIRPIPDTMALVSAVLPVAQAVAVHAALSQAALSAKAAGDERGKGQLMADTLVERVTGQTQAGDVPVEVQVVITDRALIEGADTPAHIPGYGPVPAGWARDLLTRDLAPVGPPRGPASRANVRATPSGPSSPSRPSSPSGPSSPSDASDPDTAVRPGVRPIAGVASGPGAASPSAAAGSEAASFGARAAAIWFRRLFTHPGTGSLVAMDSSRRLFPAGLRRFVVARDGQCRTPWCDAPVAHIDHVQPYAQGGPTTTATNGQGLCVRCNLVKEEPGWTAAVIDPGPSGGTDRPHTVQIVTPTGHTYRSLAPPVLPGLEGRPRSKGRSTRPDATVFDLVRNPYFTIELAS
ncbi:DUF222 domain-containing protein [Monashia sp. NPDC004114]